MRRLVTAALALALTAGCGGPATPGELGPEQLGRLGARIYQSPDQAAEVLAEEGLTSESFEAQVRAVTTDPERARAYSEAFRAELGGVEPGTAVAGTAPTPVPTPGP